ncbi:MAG: patatin [Actinobacteria bacterium HGW-Actinobacteria-7]|jgi:NTE family protein|nr:MAG: patatin [Actinobacteria bacterium HGW-Actinobacteria-7]
MPWSLFHRAPKPRPAEEHAAPLRIGLALGGGAVRGAAHLGVLSVFERASIAPDVVAGTSVGAVVGAGLAAGVPAAEVLAAFGGAGWTRLAKPAWRSKRSMLDTNPMGELLEKVTSATTFAELKLPFAAVASDILTGTTVVMTEGLLSEAVVASSAIPVIFEPVSREGHLLVDGGLTDNLPVDAARQLGADFVIAVDIMPPLDGTYEPHDMRDMVLLSWNIVERGTQSSAALADFVITPDVVRVSLSDFSQLHLAYEAGVAAAEAALPALLIALGRKPISQP